MAGQTIRRELARKALFNTSQLLPAAKGLLSRGTQVLYVPQHCNDDLFHKDVEAGFVTSVSESFAFCRYWRKEGLTLKWYDLRTKLNSEATNFCDLFIVATVDRRLVEEALEKYC